MSITFRRGVREAVGLVIGMAGPSGGGKTFSAMRLAAGIAGDKPFALIDTEARRGLHYADRFAFDHADLKAPFTPAAYAEAITAADKAGYPVIVVYSCSHEWAGDGGLLDMQEEEFQRLGARDTVKMTSWIKPKMAHKQMVQRLLQVRAHLILCFRAEQKIDMVKNAQGKMEIQPKKIASGFSDWIPIAEKNLLYELTASFLLTPDRPGIPQPIKLQDQHRALFPLTEPIGEKAGKALAAWAIGGAAPKAEPPAVLDHPDPRTETLTAIEAVRARMNPTAAGFAAVCAAFNIADLATSDVAALDDLLTFLRDVEKKDAKALKRLAEIVKPVAA